MRKYQQTRLLELTKILEKVHVAFERMLGATAEQKKLNDLFDDCQHLAVSIGTYLESIEDKGTQTADLIKEYGGMLHNLKQKRTHSNLTTLKKQLSRINNSINSELTPTKIEVVFLPYKVAMSDSLESIWQTALADPDCDAYVIPVPYYEKNPDGTFGSMYYEGDLYPSNVPVTHWQEYDIAKRCPDIIFIHLPYDEGNNVTSLHPDFYSNRLRNFTGLLVYVPYFVCLDNVPKELCVHSGTVYADKVIVQSEKVRQTYIREFKETEEKCNLKNIFGNLEEKIIALGSPKIDKILSTKRENCVIPCEWRRLIEKPDGTNKKIIFYNTTLSAILRGNEQYLIKLLSVFDLFRKRDDVVLWWRPHPLSHETYRSMRPHLLNIYEQIVANYKRGGWGIYDDTSNLHRAISLSDIYYGDRSSVVAMYQATGKPIIIQNVNVIKRSNFYDIAFFAPVFSYDDNILFNSDRFNALININKKTLEPEFLGNFPCVSNKQPLYRQAVLNNGCIYFAPCLAEEIAEYNISLKTFETISFSREKCNKNDNRDFYGAMRYKQYIFFTPYKYNAIMRLNSETKEVDFFDDWITPLKELTSNEKDGFFLYPLLISENTFFLAALNANSVVEFNMETLKSVVHKVGKKGYQFNGICFDGARYWLSPRHDGPVVKWDPKYGVIKEFAGLAEGSPQNQFCFHPIIFCEGYVWLIPNQSRRAVKIDVKTDTVITAEEFMPNFIDGEERMHSAAYYFARNLEPKSGVIYAYDGKDGTLIEYDCKTKNKRTKIIKYPPSVMAQIKPAMQRVLDKNFAECKTPYSFYYTEKPLETIGELIDYNVNNYDPSKMAIMQEKQLEFFKDMGNNADGLAGERIFTYCKKAILK